MNNSKENMITGRTLLIVDDSSIIIERLLDALKDHPTIRSILTATNYDEAVEVIDGNKPDIVLLDIQLTGKNGIDLLKYIKQRFPEVKVIMFTNHADDNYFKLCKQLGALYCVDKSKDFDKIPGMLATVSE
ncbi:MAG: response regulator transcription factor [Ferruginibacter sp.]